MSAVAEMGGLPGQTAASIRREAWLRRLPLLPAFMIRQADNRFVGELGDPIVVDSTKPTEEAVRAATQAFATQLEDRIRAHPHLWYQFYPYWSTTDAAEVLFSTQVCHVLALPAHQSPSLLGGWAWRG